MSRKIFPGAVSVLRDRPLQGIEPVELLLVAQLLEEADLQMAAIKLLVAIEQMHLQQRHRDGVHRRAPANAGHPRAEAFDLHGEDAAEPRLPPQHRAPKRKSRPTSSQRVPSPRSSTSSTKRSAGSEAKRASKRTICTRLMPVVASSSSLSRRRVRRAGAASREKNSRGCGSKVR